jgi:ABC-type siderophore export system fused ATPase/permease subunit
VLVWLALLLWLVLSFAGLAFAIVRGWQAFRQAKRTGSAVTAQTERIVSVTEQIQANLERAQRAQGDLEAATGRLQQSRQTLDVLLAAIREARAALESIAPVFGSR